MLTLQRKWAPLVALLLAVVFLNLVVPPLVWAQAAGADDTLRSAEVSYLEGDYEGAVGMLEPMLTTGTLTKTQTAKTHELLAYCYDALDKEEKIRENIRVLFEMNRKYPMKSEWMADRMNRIVEEVQADLAREDSEAEATTTVAEEPSGAPDHMTEGEAGGKSNTKKYLIYGGAAVVGIGLIALLAGGGGDAELDTLPTAPGVPTKK